MARVKLRTLFMINERTLLICTHLIPSYLAISLIKKDEGTVGWLSLNPVDQLEINVLPLYTIHSSMK